MTEKTFWAIVEAAGWGTRTADFRAVKRQLMEMLPLAKAKELRDVFSNVRGKLAQKAELGGCDSANDCVAHVVGLGRDEYDACMKDPKRIHARYRKGDYVESFAYCFPDAYDYERTKIKYYQRQASELYEQYMAASKDETYFKVRQECVNVYRAMEYLTGDFGSVSVEAFLAVESSARTAASAVAQFHVNLLHKLSPGTAIDGSSVGNAAPVDNLYSDLRESYLPNHSDSKVAQLSIPDRLCGLSVHRFKDNPEEKRFAEAWARWHEQGRLLDHLLDTRKEHTGYPPEPSDRDHRVAASVIQWLGSPVGQEFLQELGYIRKAAK